MKLPDLVGKTITDANAYLEHDSEGSLSLAFADGTAYAFVVGVEPKITDVAFHSSVDDDETRRNLTKKLRG